MAFDVELRRQILERVDSLLRDRVAPRAAEIDAEDAFAWDLWQAAAEAGLFGLGIPEQYDGLGRDLVTPLLISERPARVSAAFAPTFNNTTDSVVPLVMAGSERIKAKYLPRLAAGELVPCISFSEPRGGGLGRGRDHHPRPPRRRQLRARRSQDVVQQRRRRRRLHGIRQDGSASRPQGAVGLRGAARRPRVSPSVPANRLWVCAAARSTSCCSIACGCRSNA